MSKEPEKFFLLKSNPQLNFKKHFKELIKFQLDRIEHFYPHKCWLFDSSNLLKTNDVKYEQTLYSKEEVKNWVVSLDASDQIFLIDSVNPFLDIELVNNLSNQFKNSNRNTLQAYGAIPGTAPDLVTFPQF